MAEFLKIHRNLSNIRGNYRQNDRYEQKQRDEKTGMCKVTIKSKFARVIWTRLAGVGLKAGETGCGQIRTVWASSSR